jgi:hypothetical protein
MVGYGEVCRRYILAGRHSAIRALGTTAVSQMESPFEDIV